MPLCHFCHAPAEATVNRLHRRDKWEVRLHTCDTCLCSRVPVLSEDDAIDEQVAPIGVTTLAAFAPFISVPYGPLTSSVG